MADATYNNLTVTGKLILRTTAADPYTEIQWQDESGEVIAQIVAHLDVHSGRSSPDGGHLSFYIRDNSLPEGRRGAIDIDTSTNQNGHKPVARYENMGIVLRDGSTLYAEFPPDSGTWYKLGCAPGKTARWEAANLPPYP